MARHEGGRAIKSRDQRREEQEEALRLREKVEARLLAIPGVRAVGVGLKEVGGALTEAIVLRVYVERKRPETELSPDEILPKEIDGIGIDVLEHHPTTQTSPDQGRYRPIRGGIQIGNDTGAAGTLACVAQRNSDHRWVVLSNSHVMMAGKSLLDTDIRIAQPSVSGCCCCTCGFIGTVLDSQIGGKVDCAIAAIDDDVAHIQEIIDIGGIAGVAAAVVGDKVQKRGRTSHVTSGTVVDIAFPTTSGSHSFTDQIRVTPDAAFPNFQIGGDSGAALVNETRHVVGLMWGKNGHDGVACHIAEVQTALDITIPAATTTSGADTVVSLAAEAAYRTGTLPARRRDLEEVLFGEMESHHPLGRLINQHQAEIFELIQHNREVGVRWQRNQGPAFAAAFERTTRKIDYRVPEAIEGVSLTQLLLDMAAVLERNGSAELRRDLRHEGIALIPRLQDCRTADALWQQYELLKHEFQYRKGRA